MNLRAIDLFAGAGGLSCGFEWAGGTVVGGVEIDPWAAATFRTNHPEAVLWGDILATSPAEVSDRLGPIDVVLGGPMCQGVSQRGPRDPHDKRNFAFWEFARFVRELSPRYFIMENVPALASDVHNRSLAIAVFRELEGLGYHLSAEVMNAAWFGVPQLRYRLVILGSKSGVPTLPDRVAFGIAGRLSETEFTSVGDALMDLPRVTAGGGADIQAYPEATSPASWFQTLVREGATDLFNHWSADTDSVNLNRIRHVPEGGNWHDIPAELVPPRFLEVRPSDHTTTYRRLDRRHPAHTITTECGNVTSGAFTHPTQDRAITVREAARLQGFPDRFRFCGPKNAQYKQVGNAVPPLMARQLVETLVGVRPSIGYRGRLSLEVLGQHPSARLPFTLAPRYRPLFGQSSGAVRNASDIPKSLPLVGIS